MDLCKLVLRALDVSAPLTEAEHQALIALDRPLYASLLGLEGINPNTSMGIIIQLLATTEGPRSLDAEDQLIESSLPQIDPERVLEGFRNLHKKRVNNQRSSGAIRSYLLGSPGISALAVKRRREVAAALRHAMGRRVVSTCLHFLARPKVERTVHEQRYLRRHILRFASDGAPAIELFQFLFGRLEKAQDPQSPIGKYLAAKSKLSAGKGLPYKTLRGIASTYHPGAHRHQVARLAASAKVKRDAEEARIENDSSSVGLLRRYYASRNAELLEAAKSQLFSQLDALPSWPVRLGIVLDASLSMRGVGHRLYNSMAIAQSVAWALQRFAQESFVEHAGGLAVEGDAPLEPSGTTRLAPALLAALQKKPDGVVVLTDGYENSQQGDLAAVLQGLEVLNCNIPCVQVTPAFTEREHLDGRQLMPTQVLETAQSSLLPLWIRVGSALNEARTPLLIQQALKALKERRAQAL